MQVTILHIYQEGQFQTPLAYQIASKAREQYELLKDTCRVKESENHIDEWSELGGISFSCCATDTLVRLVTHELTESELQDLHTYTEYESDRHYQLRIAAAGYYGAMRRELKGFIEENARNEELELTHADINTAVFRSEGGDIAREAAVQAVAWAD